MLQPKLIQVEPVFPMKLRLAYETGEVKLFDVTPYATGPWYGELLDQGYSGRFSFRRTGLASCGATDRTSRPMSCMKTAWRRRKPELRKKQGKGDGCNDADFSIGAESQRGEV